MGPKGLRMLVCFNWAVGILAMGLGAVEWLYYSERWAGPGGVFMLAGLASGALADVNLARLRN